MELALGTVQFGLTYGIANNTGQTLGPEARAIIERAHAFGIRRLDTAAAYGNIEERLSELCGDLDVSIVSKIPPIGSQMPVAEALDFIQRSMERSKERLGPRLTGILFHDIADLHGERGNAFWDRAIGVAERYQLSLGGSCYDPASLLDTAALRNFSMAQLPGNALDQRIAGHDLRAIEVTVRSALLQGLLMFSPRKAEARLPAAVSALARWSDWCEKKGMDRLVAAFSIVKGFRDARYCVIGVDNMAQLEANLIAWDKASAISAPDLAVSDPNIFDPRLWPRGS